MTAVLLEPSVSRLGDPGPSGPPAISPATTRVVLIAGDPQARRRLIAAVEVKGDLRVVADTTSANGFEVITREQPDVAVIVLSTANDPSAIEDVLHLTRRLTARVPLPVLVIQAPGSRQGRTRMAALLAGAVEVIATTSDPGVDGMALRQAIRSLQWRALGGARQGGNPRLATAPLPVVGLCASAGGPKALAVTLSGLAGLAAAVVVVQHLPDSFEARLLDLLRVDSALPVVAAAPGTILRPGVVFVAPPDRQVRVTPARRLALDVLPPGGRPGADALFRSMAETVGRHGIGVVLTGMGADGAAGLLSLREAGGLTIAQDEGSAYAYGMPRAAREAGAARRILPLDEIAAGILDGVAAVVLATARQ